MREIKCDKCKNNEPEYYVDCYGKDYHRICKLCFQEIYGEVQMFYEKIGWNHERK